MTKGELELVREIEKVFAACKAHGLLVMVTTSHSAPYAAASEVPKLASNPNPNPNPNPSSNPDTDTDTDTDPNPNPTPNP